MNIRKVQKGDTLKVRDLIQDIMQSEFGPGEQKAYPMDDILGLPKSYENSRDVFYVVTEGPQKIVATCAVKEEGNGVGLLRRIFVHPEYRRKGVGERIVRRTIRFCREQGYRVLTVQTTSTMQAALALLLKIGFQDRASIHLGKIRILKLSYDCQAKKQ